MTWNTLLLVVAVLTAAGFIQGLTGFGFSLFAMGLLPRLLAMEETQAVVTVNSLVACLAMAGVSWRDVQWSDVWHLWVSCALGTPLGFFLLRAVPESWALRVLGLTICALVLFEVLVARRKNLHFPPQMGWGLGLLSGMLGGAFNVGGPPLVIYIYDRPWTKAQHVATLSAIFTSNIAIRLGLLLGHSQVSAACWVSAAWAVVPMLLAVIVGKQALRYVPQAALRTAIDITLLALGAHYLIWG